MVSFFYRQKNRSCLSWRERIKSSVTTVSRSRRDALLMAPNTRLQVDYLLSVVTGYEMPHAQLVSFQRC